MTENFYGILYYRYNNIFHAKVHQILDHLVKNARGATLREHVQISEWVSGTTYHCNQGEISNLMVSLLDRESIIYIATGRDFEIGEPFRRDRALRNYQLKYVDACFCDIFITNRESFWPSTLLLSSQ